MKKLSWLLIIACVSFFVACEDKEDDPIIEDDYASEVVGTYGSILDIDVPELEQSTSTKDIKLTKMSNQTVKVELNNFQFGEGEGAIAVGNIVIENVPLQKNGSGFSLAKTKVKGVKLESELVADIELSGVIDEDLLDLDILVNTDIFDEPITVKAMGLKGGQYSYDNAKNIEGSYNSELNIQAVDGMFVARTKNEIVLTRKEDSKIDVELKDFRLSRSDEASNLVVEDLEIVRDGQTYYIKEKPVDLTFNGVNIKATLEGRVKGGKLALTIKTEEAPEIGAITVAVAGVKEGVKSSAANIFSLVLESDAIIGQPEIGNQTEFEVEFGDLTEEELVKLSQVVLKTLVLSDGATADVVEGAQLDFSENIVYINVTAEDGVTAVKYAIKVKGARIIYKTFFDFEEWEKGKESGVGKAEYFSPISLGQWSWESSNAGAKTLISMNKTDRFCVTQNEEAYEGESAAKIETLDTKGASLFGQIIPKVTAGSLYNGWFKLDWDNTLLSTKFGSSFSRKPLELSFYYKYTPGKVFYRSSGDPKQAHKASVEEGTIDKCSVNAILYEIANDDDDYITGVKTYEDPRIIAKATFESDETVTEYKKISEKFVYKEGKTYDSSKKYRLAFIASSSSEGNSFSGAPESVLYLDNLEIISE